MIVAAFLQLVFLCLAWLSYATGTRVTVLTDVWLSSVTGIPLGAVTDVATAAMYVVAGYTAYRTAVFVFWRLPRPDPDEPEGLLAKSPCKPATVDPWTLAKDPSGITRWRCRVLGFGLSQTSAGVDLKAGRSPIPPCV